jgi:HAD superfamily hydrolase (TIGR01509 family)
MHPVPEDLDLARLKAVVFDVDGTLYRQAPLRRAMALRLLRAHLFRPLRGLRTLRVIGAYRRAQEHLRDAPAGGDLATAQLQWAAERTGVDRSDVAACVARWMEEAPLDLLPRLVQPGLAALLGALRARGLRLGVLSDYPAGPKLHALGLDGLFDAVLCAQAPEIGVFKPHPRGLQVVLERLGVAKEEALYVGDRVEVDAVAAAAAGVTCVILAPGTGAAAATFHQVTSYPQLQQRLFPS